MKRILEFLELYNSKNTKGVYQSSIIKFLEFIYNRKRKDKKVTDKEIEEFERLADQYFKENRNYGEDLVKFASFLAKNNIPPKTASAYISGLKEWFIWNGIELSERIIKEVRRKLPKGGIRTTEEPLTKDKLRKILSNCDIKGKALFTLMASTGLRISEALSLEMDDLRLHSDPAEIIIRGEKSKTGEQRVVFLTAEAKKLLLDWLEVRDQFLQKSYERTETFRKIGKTPIDLSDKRVFPFHQSTAEKIWKETLEKAGLLKIDKSTGRKTLTIHSLRKFFRTQLVKAKIPQEVIDSLMGHNRLSLAQIYTKIPREEIIRLWRKAEVELTIFGSAEVDKLKEQLKERERELQLKEKEIEERLKQIQQQIELKIRQESIIYKSTLEGLVKDKIELETRLKKLEEENALLRRKLEELEQNIINLLIGNQAKVKIPGKTNKEIFKTVKESLPDLVIDEYTND